MKEKRNKDQKFYRGLTAFILIGVPILFTVYISFYSIDKKVATTLILLFLFVVGEYIQHRNQRKGE